VDELELLKRCRPEPAPSPELVARHRRELADAMEPSLAEPDSGRPRARLARLAVAAVMLAGILAGTLSRDEGDATRVVTAAPAEATTTTQTTAAGTIAPCGSGMPGAIPEGPPDHRHEEDDPASISVRIYACRIDPSRPRSLTGPDGVTLKFATTLRELVERFGGLEGTVIDQFGRAHSISLAPLAGADPDTTAVGLVWSARPRDAPPIPPGLQQPPPTSFTLDPPWVGPPRP
jgi:hypothetical protein